MPPVFNPDRKRQEGKQPKQEICAFTDEPTQGFYSLFSLAGAMHQMQTYGPRSDIAKASAPDELQVTGQSEQQEHRPLN